MITKNMKIKELTDKQLEEMEKKYRDKIINLRNQGRLKSQEYDDLHHAWFLLREAGTIRGLWIFVIAPERQRERGIL